MCFSPDISFAAGAALTATGIITLRKTERWQERLFATLPLLFGIQQIIEGFLWLKLLEGGSGPLLTLAYTAFVGIVWPVIVPLSIRLIEPKEIQQKLMLMPLTIGSGIAIYTLYSMLEYGVTSRIAEQCILYESQAEGKYNTLFYVAATCTAFFLSSQRNIRLFGLVNLAAFFVAFHYYRFHFVSVWCLFAAVVSTLIYLYFRNRTATQSIISAT